MIEERERERLRSWERKRWWSRWDENTWKRRPPEKVKIVLWRLGAEWPDVKLKSSPIFGKSNHSNQCNMKRVLLFTLAFTMHLGYFLHKPSHRGLQKSPNLVALSRWVIEWVFAIETRSFLLLLRLSYFLHPSNGNCLFSFSFCNTSPFILLLFLSISKKQLPLLPVPSHCERSMIVFILSCLLDPAPVKAETNVCSDRPSIQFPAISNAFVNKKYFFFITQMIQLWHLWMKSLLHINK